MADHRQEPFDDAFIESSDVPAAWFEMSHWTDGRLPGGDHWGELIRALRHVQDLVAGTDPSDEQVLEATRHLDAVTSILEPARVPETRQAYGRRLDLPGVGQTLRPIIVRHETERDRWAGTVTFTRVYLGAGHAVHGGVISMMFDNFLGGLVNSGGRTPCRTAYLHVDYRALTPMDTECVVEAWFHQEEGRKRLVRGLLRHGDVVCAEAEGLFIQLREPPTAWFPGVSSGP